MSGLALWLALAAGLTGHGPAPTTRTPIGDELWLGLDRVRLPVAKNALPDERDVRKGSPVITILQDGRMIAADGFVYERGQGLWMSLGGKRTRLDRQKATKAVCADICYREVYDPRSEPGASRQAFFDLAVWLTAAAQRMDRAPHDPEDRDGHTLPDGEVLIRADDSTLFHFVRMVMEQGANPGIHIWKYAFAVAGEGDRVTADSKLSDQLERVLPVRLPKGLDPPSQRRVDLTIEVLSAGETIEVDGLGREWESESPKGVRYDLGTRRLEYRVGSRSARELSGLRELIGEEEEPSRVRIMVDARLGATYGDVVRTLDGLLELGFSNIGFTAHSIVKPFAEEDYPALDHGLEWLARHQSPDGSWDGDGFEAQCADEAGVRVEDLARRARVVEAQQDSDQAGDDRRVAGGLEKKPPVALLGQQPDL